MHYYGNSRRNTGDWALGEEFITFKDIASLYMRHSRGRFLTIIPDCHSSGKWVSECAKFLDEQGVKPPCGHSAKEKRTLLKVYASCRTGQDSAELCYTTRAMELEEDGIVYHHTSKNLSAKQHTLGVDFTKMSCGKGEEEKCTIPADGTLTWSTAWEVIDHRKRTVRGKAEGLPAWLHMIADDDAEKIEFLKNPESEFPNLDSYGKVWKRGWGKDPPPEEDMWFYKKYGYP